MKEVETVAAFYTRGPHFTRMLQHLRKTYPNARITAITPPAFPKEALIGQADRLVHTAKSQYGLRDPLALLELVRQLRRPRYDLFVVMFDTPKQRMLAALSGSRRRSCYSADGRFFPLGRSPFPHLLRAIVRRVAGEVRYQYIRYIVYHRPVKRG